MKPPFFLKTHCLCFDSAFTIPHSGYHGMCGANTDKSHFHVIGCSFQRIR